MVIRPESTSPDLLANFAQSGLKCTATGAPVAATGTPVVATGTPVVATGTPVAGDRFTQVG